MKNNIKRLQTENTEQAEQTETIEVAKRELYEDELDAWRQQLSRIGITVSIND